MRETDDMTHAECTCTWRPEALHGNDHHGATLTATRVDSPDCPEHADAPRRPEPRQPLTRAQRVRLSGVVYCLDHGTVHENSTAPYGPGDECRKQEHRSVYASLWAGDYPDAGE